MDEARGGRRGGLGAERTFPPFVLNAHPSIVTRERKLVRRRCALGAHYTLILMRKEKSQAHENETERRSDCGTERFAKMAGKAEMAAARNARGSAPDRPPRFPNDYTGNPDNSTTCSPSELTVISIEIKAKNDAARTIFLGSRDSREPNLWLVEGRKRESGRCRRGQ